MAFSRDWLEANPIDRSKFKEAPGAIRATKVDVSDRLKSILSGFTSGETAWGIKLGKYLTQGTAAPSAPSGTGAAQDMNFYIRTIGTGTYADAYIRGTSGPEVRMTIFGRLCLDNARMSNDTYILGTDTNGAAQNILKLNTANAIEFASHIIAPNTGPTTALQLAPKGYVDAANLSQTISAAQLVGALGAWVDKSASYAAQTAPADGLVSVFISQTTQGLQGHMIGYTDVNANPTTVRGQAWAFFPGAGYEPDSYSGFTMPVRKGDYWKCVKTGDTTTLTVYFIPLGS
jgi:hypothetical protein